MKGYCKGFFNSKRMQLGGVKYLSECLTSTTWKMLTHPASDVPRSWSFSPAAPFSLPWGNWLCNVCPEQVSSVTLSPILAYGCRQDSPLLLAGPYRSCLCSCSRGPVAGGRGGHHSTRITTFASKVPSPSPSSSHRLPPQLHCPLGRTTWCIRITQWSNVQ